MLAPPSITRAPYYPVTSSVGVAAIALTLVKWSDQSIDELLMTDDVWAKWQLWRALTATLLHGSFFHIAFNLYWFWTFGTLIERVFGSLRCLGIFVLLSLGSMLAEYSVLYGGIGLSGVVYGYWGMLWVLEARDNRFMDAVDQPTSQTFIIWFFLCIVLTITGIMPVANVAHGIGGLMGVMLGFVICGRRQLQRECMAGLVVLLALVISCSTAYFPAVNFSRIAPLRVEYQAELAMGSHETTRAVRLFKQATRSWYASAGTWYNLGAAYEELGRHREALAAFQHAARMPDADPGMKDVAKELEAQLLNTTNR